MNTANKFTLFRVILVPVFMALFMCEGFWLQIAAIGVFILASITDAVDGHIARSKNQITTFGKFADPLADKMLTTAAFLVIMYKGFMSPWAIMIVLAREFMVSGVRLAAASDGKVIAASMWGKAKTVSQMIAIIASMVLILIGNDISYIIIDVLIWISVVLTVISGVDYLVKNWHLMKLK